MGTKQEYSLEKIIKILFIIILIVLIFYGITILITKYQKNKQDETTSDVDIQYNEILIGSMYQQKEDEYYVLVELESDYSNLYSKVNNYQQSGKTKLYTATLDKALNKKYMGEESNFDTKFPTFKESTLLKINNGSIIEHYEGVTSILKIIGE